MDRVLFTLVSLQQNNEFQLICAVLCQNLRARHKRRDVVSPLVECGQCASAEAAFSWEEKKNEVLLCVWSSRELKENFTFISHDLSLTCGSLGKQVVNRIRNSIEGGEASDFLK